MGSTASGATRALQDIKSDARSLFIKIYCFRPTDRDLKAILEAENYSCDLRCRHTWQQLHALLLGQQQAQQQTRAASQERWETRTQQWTQWLAEFQQVLQAQAAARECRWEEARAQQRTQPRSPLAPDPSLSRHPSEVLGLDPATATVAAVKQAYRRLARQHHPDCGGRADRFREISQAYELLMQGFVSFGDREAHRTKS